MTFVEERLHCSCLNIFFSNLPNEKIEKQYESFDELLFEIFSVVTSSYESPSFKSIENKENLYLFNQKIPDPFDIIKIFQ